MVRQVRPVRRSATRISNKASQHSVGGDALVEPVVDRPQVEGGFHGAEGAFGLEEVLVAECDVFRRQVRVAGRDEVFAVEVGLGGDFRGVDRQSPGGGVLFEPAAQDGVVTQRAFGLAMR